MVRDLLVDVGVLVEHEFVVDGGIEDALEHQDVTDYLTCHKSVLHFLVWDKVIEPILSELRDSTHLEEIGTLHVSADVFFGSLAYLALIITHAIGNLLMLELDGLTSLPQGFHTAVGSDFRISPGLLHSMGGILTRSHRSRLFFIWSEVHHEALSLIRVNHLLNLFLGT